MRARGVYRAAALLACLLFSSPLCAKKDGPDFHVKKLNNYPANLNYFTDSEVILFQDETNSNVYRSPDAGVTWEIVDAVPEGHASVLLMHEYDNDRAYILTEGLQHFRTHDRGKTWERFQTETGMSKFRRDILQFHAEIPDRIIFNGMTCDIINCDEVAMYTDDGFRTPAKLLRGNTAGCWWAKSSGSFSTGDESKDKNRILCIALDPHSIHKQDQRLLISDDFFRAANASGALDEFEPKLDTNRPIQGVVNMAVVKKFLLVAAASANTDEMALYVTENSINWHRAIFPTDHRVEQEAYTALESTEYSIQIDVMTTRPSNPMGVLFTSNSDGRYFTRNIEHTNRNRHGHVDFEKIAGIQGIFLLNKVDNWKEVERKPSTEKKVVTEITFDDGRTFEEVKADGKRLHLHSVTDLSNVGRVFSSPAPGLVMGIGNTGEELTSYSDGNLYISDNAGLTWIKGLDGPHKYEFGDQGSILVAVKDSAKVDISEIKYSLDHGQSWKTASLPDDLKIQPSFLTTTQDSTTLKFILVGQGAGDEKPFHVIAIDFDGLHEATCKKSDLEDWFARVDDEGKPTCLMGHTQKFHRRKKDAECFMKEEHKDIKVETEDCECSDQDFECDYDFVRDGKDCVTKVAITPPEEACKGGSKPDDTFLGPSGWRLIPGNTCKRTKGSQKDDKVERKCSEATTPGKPPGSGEIQISQHVFEGDWTSMEKHYLERGDSSLGDDETVIVRPRSSRRLGPIWITQDHGKTWAEPKHLPSEDILWIIPHHYFKDMVFFITETETVHYTPDRGRNFHSFKAPHPPPISRERNPLSFHPDNNNWLLWLGEKCEHDKCHLVASYSKDRGDHWQTAARYVERCEFTGSDAFKYPGREVEQIICLQRASENDDKATPLHLVSSDDWFDHQNTLKEDVKNFATMAEFIVAATENAETQSLRALASLDGKTFAEAQFPYNFEVPHQHAYTVLDSSTHAVNLFVVTETKENRMYGSIMKSNSNGTSYVLSIAGVNCDDSFYVDFEKMLGLEGVALVNIVANRDAKDGVPKELRTKMTHNDGAEWSYLPPPNKDVDGKPFGCGSSRGDPTCALHIHGYTERVDHRKTYSSKSAVGLMFGWGNVGSSLGSAKDADTYMTTDAGITWKQVKKGRWTWAVGDQGSVIALIQTSRVKKTTNVVSYSTDEGATWTDYKFSEEEVEIVDVATMRSGNSRNVLLIGKSGSEMFTINLDFSGLSDRQCKYDEQDPSKSDYYLWSPKHPLQDNGCLFGHITQYLRKKPEKSCYNGFKMEHIYKEENCGCTREDYEW